MLHNTISHARTHKHRRARIDTNTDPHTDKRRHAHRHIFPLTAADASRYVLSFPPDLILSVTATGIIRACGLYGLVLSKPLRNTLQLRLRALLVVRACVCVHILCVRANQSRVSAQPGFCGVCSSLSSRGTVNTALLPLTPSMRERCRNRPRSSRVMFV